MAISSDSATAFPLIRQFDGVWVDRTHSQWVARYTRFMLEHDDLPPARRQELMRYHDEDLVRLLSNIERNKPEVILVDVSPRDSWLMPELEAFKPHFLDGYTTVTEQGWVRVLERRDR
jgi:hypothetical protein